MLLGCSLGLARHRFQEPVKGIARDPEVLGHPLHVYIFRGEHPLGHFELMVGQRLPPFRPPALAAFPASVRSNSAKASKM